MILLDPTEGARVLGNCWPGTRDSDYDTARQIVGASGGVGFDVADGQWTPFEGVGRPITVCTARPFVSSAAAARAWGSSDG
jgi:hypothetical protein